MPPTNTTESLADYQQRYRELAAQLPTIGMIHSGSITRRYTRCATPGCKCHADPPQPHGPYYQWTAKVNGKTVTRRISEREADLYQPGSLINGRAPGGPGRGNVRLSRENAGYYSSQARSQEDHPYGAA